MKDFLHFLDTKAYAYQSQQRILKQVHNFIRWLDKHDIKPSQASYKDVTQYLAIARQRNVATQTINNYLSHLKIFFQYLHQRNIIQHNPIQFFKLRYNPQYIRRENLLLQVLHTEQINQAFYIFCQNNRIALRSKSVLALAAFQAIAPSEEQLIKVKHIDLIKAQIHIPGSSRHKERTLPLAASQIIILQQATQALPPNQHIIQYRSQKHALNARSNLFKQLNIELQRQNISFRVQNMQHIRRSIITHWIKQHGIRKTQYMAGHRNICSTEKYVTNDIEQLKSAIQKFHPLNTFNKSNKFNGA